MKKTVTLIIVLLFTTSNLLLGQSDNLQIESLGSEIKSIVEETKSVEGRLIIDIEALFEQVESSISTGNKVSKKIDSWFSKNNGQKTTSKELQSLYEIVNSIHTVFTSIDENRKTLYGLLINYDETLSDQVEKSKNLKSLYKKHLDDNKQKRDELRNKIDRSGIEEFELNSYNNNVEILSGILQSLDFIINDINNIYKNYEIVNNQVTDFFKIINLSAITSQYLKDYLSINVEYSLIRKNANNILKLDELTKGLNDSMQNLTKSIIQLEKTAKETSLPSGSYNSK